jgi:hypothetical protein
MRGTMIDAILKQQCVGGVPDAAAVCLLHSSSRNCWTVPQIGLQEAVVAWQWQQLGWCLVKDVLCTATSGA